MTTEELDKIIAGPELNRLIGEKVFHYDVYHYDKDVAENCYYMLVGEQLEKLAPFDPTQRGGGGERKNEAEAWADCPNFSGNLIAAFTLVEQLAHENAITIYALHCTPTINHDWMVFINDITAYGDTLPIAICRAVYGLLKEQENC